MVETDRVVVGVTPGRVVGLYVVMAGPVVVTKSRLVVVVVMTGVRGVVVGISFPHCCGAGHDGHEVGAGHVLSTALPHSFLSHLN